MLPEGASIHLTLDAADVQRECTRLGDELARLEKLRSGLRAKLANASFTSRAPAEVVAGERVKEQEWSAKCGALAAKLAALGCP